MAPLLNRIIFDFSLLGICTNNWALDSAGGTNKALISEPFMAFGGGSVPAGTPVKAPTPTNPIHGIIAGPGNLSDARFPDPPRGTCLNY
jgi:hypothetical protein